MTFSWHLKDKKYSDMQKLGQVQRTWKSLVNCGNWAKASTFGGMGESGEWHIVWWHWKSKSKPGLQKHLLKNFSFILSAIGNLWKPSFKVWYDFFLFLKKITVVYGKWVGWGHEGRAGHLLWQEKIALIN